MSLIKNITDNITNTPLIELSNIYSGKGKIYGKMEFVQPGGSVKDRAALQIIKDAYKSGKLVKGQIVVEMTSGNMGSGLAVVCLEYGNPFIAIMSEGNSSERVRFLKALGAKVVLTPQVDGEKGKVTGKDIEKAVITAQKIAKEKDAFYVDQFNNPSSITAHYLTTGPEIINDLSGNIGTFITGVGTGGTFIGTAKFLKEQSKKIECIAVEPENAAILKTGTVKNQKHIIQGTGYSLIPPHWNDKLADDIITVSDTEAENMTKELSQKEGLYVGYSSGANVTAAVKYAKAKNKEINIVTILCDTGYKYSKL